MDLQFDIPPPAGLRLQTYYGQDFFGTQLGTQSGARNTLPNATFKLSSTSTTLIACVGEEGAGVGKEMAYILGTPLDGQQFLTPTPLKFKGVKMGCQVVGISSGRSHTVFLTSDWEVFTLGSGHFGQLGHGNDSYQVNPRPVKGVEMLMPRGYRAVGVTAGGNHTLVTCRGTDAVEDDDILMSFGFNSSGQCGVGTYANTLLQPQYVVGFEPKGAQNKGRLPPPLPTEGYVSAPSARNSASALQATSLAAGLSHTVCATNRGTVYSWGDGKFGKLGVSVIPPTGEEGREKSRSKKKREKACTPIPIRFPPGGNAGFYSVHAGNDFTFSVLYTDSELTCVKNVYSWGYGSEGNHALNNHLHLRTPRESSHVMGILGRCSKFDLQCRGSQVCLHAKGMNSVAGGGELYTWGCNDIGQTGHDVPSRREQLELPEVEGPPGGSVWEGRNFDSKHNIFYPKRVDLDSRLLEYFDGDEEAARGHAVDVVGASLGETNLFVVADVVRIEGGVRDVKRYEIVPPAGAKGGDEGGLEVDSKSQRKSSYSAGAGGGLGTIDILTTDLANPTKDTISQVCSWCRNGRTKEILEIIERGYDIDSRDVNGNSLLIICSQNGAANLARVLVKRGADVDGKNKLGNCALHYSMYFKHEEITNFLIKVGADDTSLNDEGLTPYEGLRRAELDEL
ncbi:hypothetical protein TrST_g5578 [Triparma strigata]|nr:hypothetical protein TrST_g5578 [Triparma strigata]